VFLDLSPKPQATTPDRREDNLGYWEALHEVVDNEPPFEGYRVAHGETAALGFVTGQPFAPVERMGSILEQAAVIGTAQMRVQSFADRHDRWIQTRPDSGWFVYFRIYGPEPAAFDGTWKLPDFQRT
jgi:hypothetical protein